MTQTSTIQTGDTVEILTGKRAGQQVRVNNTWIDGQGVARVAVTGGVRRADTVRKVPVPTRIVDDVHAATIAAMTAMTARELTVRQMQNLRADARALLELVERTLSTSREGS